MSKTKSLPPKKSYEYLKAFKAEDWYEKLTNIYRLSVEDKLKLHIEASNIIVTAKEGEAPSIVQIAVPTAMILEGPIGFEGPDGSEHPVWFLPWPEMCPAMLISFNAPDTDLIESFTKTLAEGRKTWPSPVPVTKPGPSAQNSAIDESLFNVWIRQKIVPLADVLIWRAELDAADRSDWRNGRVIEYLDMTEKSFSKSKASLKKALAMLPALLNHIAPGTHR